VCAIFVGHCQAHLANHHTPRSEPSARLYRQLQREPPSLWLWLQASGFPRRILLFLLLVQTLVEPDDPPSSDQDGDDRHSDREQDKTTAELVQRLLVAEEEVRSEPVTGGTEGVGDGDQSSFLLMSGALCENTM